MSKISEESDVLNIASDILSNNDSFRREPPKIFPDSGIKS